MRHDDGHLHTILAPGESKALAVIAARCRNDTGDMGPLALQPLQIDEPSAHLEGAGGRMVLVLDDHLHPKSLRQQGPGKMGRCGHGCLDGAMS